MNSTLSYMLSTVASKVQTMIVECLLAPLLANFSAPTSFMSQQCVLRQIAHNGHAHVDRVVLFRVATWPPMSLSPRSTVCSRRPQSRALEFLLPIMLPHLGGFQDYVPLDYVGTVATRKGTGSSDPAVLGSIGKDFRWHHVCT